MFESFKNEYHKQYATMDEEVSRFNTFVANLAVIDSRNVAEAAAGGEAVHGITKFSDLSQQEFEDK